MDRASTDNLRLYCVVLEGPNTNRYKLQCKHGILNNNYPIKDLLRIPAEATGAARVELEGAPTARVTLHATAALESTSDRVSISCNCKKQCTLRCRCQKNQAKCSVYCHTGEHDCGNLSALDVRTEQVHVARTGPPAVLGNNSTHGVSMSQQRERMDSTGGQKRTRTESPSGVPARKSSRLQSRPHVSLRELEASDGEAED